MLAASLARVCSSCDAHNPPASSTCIACKAVLPSLASASAKSEKPPTWMSAPAGQPIPTGEVAAIDLGVLNQSSSEIHPPSSGPVTRPQLCSKCSVPYEHDDRFCRNCGNNLQVAQSAPVPEITDEPPPKTTAHVRPKISEVHISRPTDSSTLFFGAVAVSRQVRLVLVKGQENQVGHWRIANGETTVGRTATIDFPSDTSLNGEHCIIEHTDIGLSIRPVSDDHGVYVSIRQPTPLSVGDEFVVGTQRLRVEPPSVREELIPASAVTSTFGSMMPSPPAIVLKRLFKAPLHDERMFEIYSRSQKTLTMGRNQCDINFPVDPYISGRHAQVVASANGYMLQDVGSRNGTYVRAKNKRELLHGDAVMLGEQVLRVEIVGS